MSGHSKWSTIKHKKALIDSKRGQAFTKLIKEITLVARQGGGDPAANPRLRLLLEKAREVNMPIENSNRAIKRGTGELPGVSYEPMVYEGFGPHGIAVMVDALTDNKNRTVAEFRRLFSINGGALGETGSVNYMFSRVGVVHAKGSATEDQLLENLIEYDIKEVITNEKDSFTIHCDAKALDQVKQAVEKMGLKVESAELEWIAQTPMELPQEQADKAYEFLSELQDHEDVQNVFASLK